MKFLTTLFRITLLALTLQVFSMPAFAQQDSLNSLVKKFDGWRSSVLQEKIFAHIDRSFYLTGETMWFRLYYTDASFHKSLDISKVAYIEVINRDSKSILQTKIVLAAGGGRGSVFLPASLASGVYTVRVYTNWMKNFSPEAFFHQSITVINPFTKLGLTEPKETVTHDVQFFPEGGNLVSGVINHIGFRAVDRFGKGLELNGAIVSDNNDTVAHFHPLRSGIGRFSFTPQAGHSYTAIIKDKQNSIGKYPLPLAKSEGYALHVADAEGGKINIQVHGTGGDNPTPYCYLFVHTRETAIKTQIIYLQSGSGSATLDAATLGEGISHLTIFTPGLQPVCERLYFKQPHNLELSATTDKSAYPSRKKVTVSLTALNQTVPASLSVSVYKTDTLSAANPGDIRTYLWLTSELKGEIESPAYYLSDHGAEGREALDNLLLTHGWSRYKWDDILNDAPRTFQFLPEFRGHIVTGKVSGADIGSGKRVMTYLSNPDKNIRLFPSRSNARGEVKYELRELFGPRKLIMQTNTEKDSIYDLAIESAFAKTLTAGPMPEFNFSHNGVQEATERSLYMQVQNTFHEPKTDRFFVPSFDTTAFYGKADELYYLDDYTRFPTMEEVMKEYVPGVRVRKKKGHYHFQTLDGRDGKSVSLFREDPLVLLDGVPIFSIDRIIALDPRKVKKLEVITHKYYLGPLAFEGISSYTTYHGDLSDFELDRRALVVDYEGLQLYREFFSPKYETEAQQLDRTPDVRNLVYWKPEIITDASGKASVEFYTPDTKGKYKIVAQGLDANGKPGAAVALFTVTK